MAEVKGDGDYIQEKIKRTTRSSIEITYFNIDKPLKHHKEEKKLSELSDIQSRAYYLAQEQNKYDSNIRGQIIEWRSRRSFQR